MCLPLRTILHMWRGAMRRFWISRGHGRLSKDHDKDKYTSFSKGFDHMSYLYYNIVIPMQKYGNFSTNHIVG